MKKFILPIFALCMLAACGSGAKQDENNSEATEQTTVTEEGVEFNAQPNGDEVAGEDVQYSETKASEEQQAELPQ